MSSDAPQDRVQELGDRIDRLAQRVEGLEVRVDQLAQALAATRGQGHHVPHPVRAAEHEVEHVRDVAPRRARSSGTSKLPAFTNAPIAVVGDTLITAASFPGGKGQTTEVIAFRLGAHGSLTPTTSSTTTAAGPPTAPRSSRRTARRATRSPPPTPRARSGRTLTS